MPRWRADSQSRLALASPARTWRCPNCNRRLLTRLLLRLRRSLRKQSLRALAQREPANTARLAAVKEKG